MRGRLLAAVFLVALAGCSGGIPTSSTEDAGTVTPLPVPEDADPETGVSWVEDGRVDGAPLGAVHAASLEGAHTRVLHLHVSAGDGVYLDFREARTVGASNDSLRTRAYDGPGTARFVPDESAANVARSERYNSGREFGQRRTVDGRTERVGGSGPPPLASPVPELDDAVLVAALLENASVVERTESGGVRVVGDAVAPAAAPDYLENPRKITVRATVRANGRITHASVRYLATLDGDDVSVTQDVYWLPQSEPVVAPGWYDGQ